MLAPGETPIWSGRVAAALARTGVVARTGLRAVADALLPPQCLACGARTIDHGALCAACWSGIEFISAPLCPRTGLPFAYDPGEGAFSAAALVTPPAYERARAVARFGEVTRALVHALKYRDRLDVAPMMGRWMARAGAELLAECDMVVPVPLHPTRRWWRRYNQAALLARELAAASGKTVDFATLARTRATPAQVGRNRDERRRNVARAFAVPEATHLRIAGRRVLLVDDVITTGATVEACARTCLAAGAAAVDVLVFARVVEAEGPTI